MAGVQQIILETAALVKSVSGPEIFPDERNEVVAKLNQLLAAFGVGQGYCTEAQPPINYTNKNIFYRFKGVVYNRLCRNSDNDGIVVLVLGVPIAQLNSEEMKNKIAELINSLFGQGVTTLKAKVDGVKAISEKESEVIFYVNEQGKGRVPAITLFKFLLQPDKMQLLRTNLQCIRHFPLVEMNKADREKFLNTPPEGFDANLWRQGIRLNPDPERFLPQPIYGFEQLEDRQRMQKITNAVQATVLNEQVERLKKIENDIALFKSHLQNNKRQERELFHRFLRLAIYVVLEARQGYALNKAEDKILAQAERASVELTGPDALKDRINDILKLVDEDRSQVAKYLRGIDMTLTADDEIRVRQRLQASQTRLERIMDTLEEDRKALDIAERKR